MLLHAMAAQLAFAGVMSLFAPATDKAGETRLPTEKTELQLAVATAAAPVGEANRRDQRN